MKFGPTSTNPIEERIQYHLDCLEARKINSQEPEAPWLKRSSVAEAPVILGTPEPRLESLALPPRPRARDNNRSFKVTAKIRKTEVSRAPSAASGVATEQESSPIPSQRVKAVLTIPTLKQAKPISLLSEKTALIEGLLVRAGIPAKTVKEEALSLKVLDAYQNYERNGGPESKTAVVQKYEIGRHFCRTGMSHFSEFANVIVNLLHASELKELASNRVLAEQTVDKLRCKTSK
jgi:hypothetical protein